MKSALRALFLLVLVTLLTMGRRSSYTRKFVELSGAGSAASARSRVEAKGNNDMHVVGAFAAAS